MTLQRAIIECMNTAKMIELGQLDTEGAHIDFRSHIETYAQQAREQAIDECIKRMNSFNFINNQAYQAAIKSLLHLKEKK